jgi:two-component system cell cycle sensor histidine kinase/response regulator CckA
MVPTPTADAPVPPPPPAPDATGPGASERLLRAMLDAGLDAIVIARVERDAAGAVTGFTVLDANTRAATIAGLSREGLAGGALLTLFPQSAAWGLWEQCCAVAATQRPLERTLHAPLPGEPDRWLQRQVLPVDADTIAIASRDVSARMRQQVALKASEARHRQLFEHHGAIQLLADAETARLVDVNPAAEAFYGWSRETMRGMLAADLEAVTVAQWREEMARVATDAGARVIREHRTAGGAVRPVELGIGTVEVAGRRVWHVIIQDVSDRVRAERQLRASEARFRAVIQSMRDGVVVHDATGTVRSWNAAAERILGLTGAQLAGLAPFTREWDAVHADGSPWTEDTHPEMEALRTGRAQPAAIMGIRRGDGVRSWIQVTSDPLLLGDAARPAGAVTVFADVTASRAAEERLRETQRLEVVAQLAGGIAHEFNNLLTVIRGGTEFLQRAVPPDSTLADEVTAVERASARATQLTRHLLTIGRRQFLAVEPIDIGAFLVEVLPTLAAALPAAVTVVPVLAAERVAAALDRRELHDALLALVEHACQRMPDGGTVTVRTDVALRTAPGGGAAAPWAVLEVRDTGSAISEVMRRRLFEPYSSTARAGGWRGLGLAVVQGMVHQARGFIECDSASEQGTAIRLCFPAVA